MKPKKEKTISFNFAGKAYSKPKTIKAYGYFRKGALRTLNGFKKGVYLIATHKDFFLPEDGVEDNDFKVVEVEIKIL